MSNDDPVVQYIEDEKKRLRGVFRDKKAEIDRLQLEIQEREKELQSIKDRLSHTDEMLSLRQREQANRNASTPPLPNLGRFSNLGPTAAIKTLFEQDPNQELAAQSIAEILLKEGFKTDVDNLSATIFTSCRRLEPQFLQSRFTGNVRLFRKKSGGAHTK